MLKTVLDASVRLVVTSPPYNIGKPYGKYKDKIALNDWQELINDVTKEVCRILTPDGAFFEFISGTIGGIKRNHTITFSWISNF